MKTSFSLWLALVASLVATSCQNDDAPTPAVPTPSPTCKLAGTATNDFNIKYFYNNQGLVTTLSVTPTDPEQYSVSYTFSYNTSGQVTSASFRVTLKDRLISNQDYRITYTDGLISKVENLCSSCPGGVVSTNTMRHNANKQLVELTDDAPTFNYKASTTYTYDAAGNVAREVAVANGGTVRDMSYTYTNLKHPEQLVKGLPLDLSRGFAPWNVNIAQTMKGFAPDETGRRIAVDASLSGTPTLNAQGFPEVVRYSDGTSTTFSFTGCQ
ncbi:MAG: hypothetical protein MUC97_13485 [Bernardetiaceae bacterium]|jgi:YD repeat-containing protein|nr:hypothetical protein [Bernardetiaceae bacterium]